MAAYLIADVTRIDDEPAYAAYRSGVPASLEQAGGRYLARGGSIEVLEGAWQPSRIVIVHFESMQAAQRWWRSREYAKLKRLRQNSTRTNMVVVNGLAQGARS